MLSQIPPRTASINGYFDHLRTVPDRLRSDFMGAGLILTTIRAPVCRRVCSQFSWRFHKKAARKQPVQDPVGRIFKRARPDTDQAPRDYFLPIFINIGLYNRFLTVSTGAAQLPFGGPAYP